MADQLNIIQMPCTNYFANRDGQKPHYVILHGTAGGSSAQNIASYFQSTQGTSNPVSSHYIIGQDGAIVQCVAETNGAWANGVSSTGHASFWDQYLNAGINLNDVTISIEHVKPATDNSTALTSAQQAASFALVNAICDRWGIPKADAGASGGITGHFSMDPVNRKDCPGTYPWDALWSYLKQQEEGEQKVTITLSQVSGYFKESPTGVWLCKKTGKHIQGDILKFYQAYGNSNLCGLTYLGLPQNEEYYPGGGGNKTQRKQDFERGTVAYDPDNVLDAPPGAGNVYLMHVEASSSYTTLASEKEQLEAEVKTLQSTDAQKEIATLTTENANLTKQLTTANNTIAAVKKLVG